MWSCLWSTSPTPPDGLSQLAQRSGGGENATNAERCRVQLPGLSLFPRRVSTSSCWCTSLVAPPQNTFTLLVWLWRVFVACLVPANDAAQWDGIRGWQVSFLIFLEKKKKEKKKKNHRKKVQLGMACSLLSTGHRTYCNKTL